MHIASPLSCWSYSRRTAACLLALTACGGEAEPPSDIGELTQPVLDGRDETGRWLDAVGALLAPDVPELGLCTGTLIGPSTVLTAKHCVLGAASLVDVEFVFAVGPDALAPRAVYPIVGWAWETSVAARTDLKYGVYGSDLGIVRLASAVADVRPVALAGLWHADRGRRFRVVGYGARDDAGEFGVRQSGRMTLRGIAGNYADYAFGGLDGFVAAADSLPEYAGVAADALPHEYERLGLIPGFQAVFGGLPRDAQTCDGDSGAPFLVQRQTGLAVVALAGAGDLASSEHRCDFGSVAAVLAPSVRTFLHDELRAE
jgi:V8-like Glu-specific endopeptidase